MCKKMLGLRRMDGRNEIERNGLDETLCMNGRTDGRTDGMYEGQNNELMKNWTSSGMD